MIFIISWAFSQVIMIWHLLESIHVLVVRIYQICIIKSQNQGIITRVVVYVTVCVSHGKKRWRAWKDWNDWKDWKDFVSLIWSDLDVDLDVDFDVTVSATFLVFYDNKNNMGHDHIKGQLYSTIEQYHDMM